MSETKLLHNYLDLCTISVRSGLSSRKKLLQEMARLLSLPLIKSSPDNSGSNIEKDVYHALLEREKLGNTGIGNGVAMPHSRFEQTNEAVIAIITLETAIDYDSLDHQAVDVAFGLIVPQDANQQHLNILAEIARSMSNIDNKQKLHSAKTAQEVIKLMQSWATTDNKQ